MNFTPNIKPKRYLPKATNSKPFPPKSGHKYQGVYTGFNVQVGDAWALYENGGFFGRRMNCTTDTTPSKTFEETLVLDLEEAFFLAHILQVLEISNLDGQVIGAEQLFQRFQAVKPNFTSTLVAYIYLKSKNWLVKSGTKFGGDFLIYKQGMRFYHASFVVMVGTDSPLQSKDIQGILRVAETSDKDILLLDVHRPEITLEEFFNNLHRFSVTETIPKRFDFKKFVQLKQENR